MLLHRLLIAAAVPLLLAAAPAPRPSEGEFVVKPYLQVGRSPAPDRLQVLWHAHDGDVNWTVEHRDTPASPWIKADAVSSRRVAPAGTEPHRVFSASLTGLKPGGQFSYRVAKGAEVVFTSEARAPKAPGQPFRFVAFGDCGAGTAEQKPLAHRAYLSKPDLVVVPGDIVYEQGLISDYRDKFWPIYNAETARDAGVPLLRSTPFIAAPGNHDTDYRNLDGNPDALAYFLYWDQPRNGPIGKEGGPIVPPLIASEANRKAFVEGAGDAYPGMANFSLNYGDVHWTVIDSNNYVDWTDKALKEWVAKDLADAQDARWRFVVFHHPGFNSAREHFEQQQMRLLAPIFEAGKVDIVFNGHVHNYQRSFPMTFVPDKQGTQLIGGRDGKTLRGRVVTGRWTLDKTFNGQTDTTPQGVIYVVTGAGGQHLYNPEQNDDPDSWQKFTDKFLSKVHTLTVADVDGRNLTVRQVTADGKELDRFTITK